MIYTLENIRRESLDDNPVIYSRNIWAKDNWKTHKLRRNIILRLSNGKVITIEDGFDWDRSSVPKFLWSILPPDGDFIIGALIHDWLYVNNNYIIKEWFNGNSKKARKFSDKEMLLWSKAVNGTKKGSLKNLDNLIRYRGVRIFGGLLAWKK